MDGGSKRAIAVFALAAAGALGPVFANAQDSQGGSNSAHASNPVTTLDENGWRLTIAPLAVPAPWQPYPDQPRDDFGPPLPSPTDKSPLRLFGSDSFEAEWRGRLELQAPQTFGRQLTGEVDGNSVMLKFRWPPR